MNYQIGDVVAKQDLKNLIPVEVDNQTVAWIIPDKAYQFKLSSEEEIFLQRTNRAVLMAAGAGVLSAVLIGIVLAGMFLRPIRHLISASRKMAAGDLEQRVPIYSQDELGQLSATFNQMSADLARADQQRRQMTRR
jgi:two-component system sensor histidine kinase BaeS